MIRELDIFLLRVFATLATTRSFTETGRRLGRSQPAVSLQIKRLEDQAGLPLLDRSNGGVLLTRDGEILLSYAARILDLNDMALARMQGAAQRVVVRVGVPEDFAAGRLDPVLSRFTAACPHAGLEIEIGLSGGLEHDLGLGRFDLALVNRVDGRSGGQGGDGLVWGAADSVLAKRRPLPLVLLGDGCPFRAAALARLRDAEVPWEIICTCTAWSGVRSAVAAGIGVTAAPRSRLAIDTGIAAVCDGLPNLPAVTVELLQRPDPLSPEVGVLAGLMRLALPALVSCSDQNI